MGLISSHCLEYTVRKTTTTTTQTQWSFKELVGPEGDEAEGGM